MNSDLSRRSVEDHGKRDFLLLMGFFGFLAIGGFSLAMVVSPKPGEIRYRNPQPMEPKDSITLAAEQNEVGAQFQLGMMYSTGTNRKKDAAQAATWFRRAAHQNHADAQFELGNHYLKGEGVELNAAEAFYWICRAEQNGHKLATAKLNSAARALTLSEQDAQRSRAIADSILPAESTSQDGQNLGK